MRVRIKGHATKLVDGLKAAGVKQDMGFITSRSACSATSGLTKDQMVRLRNEFGVYGTDTGPHVRGRAQPATSATSEVHRPEDLRASMASLWRGQSSRRRRPVRGRALGAAMHHSRRISWPASAYHDGFLRICSAGPPSAPLP